ncbi:MAG: M20/M25/M40 family metallo-hydrolase [Burkholderiales bacterium]
MNAPERLPGLDLEVLRSQVHAAWQQQIVPQLRDYIAVPAKSPMFDPDWVAHGHIERVVQQACAWVESRKVPGLQLEVVRLTDAAGRPRTPVIFFELPASRGNGPTLGRPKSAQPPRGVAQAEPEPGGTADTVLVYGHLDKQPEFEGWRRDLGPWTPALVSEADGDKLYGRGGADDGYAIYASIAAIEALKAQGAPHPRIVGLIETCEESGSGDLPVYLDALKARLGDVSLVVCLDSGAGNYDQLWLTTSLRGMVSGTLRVEVLTEGVHSGDASGVVPSSFRVLRHVLDRLEDSATGRLLPQGLHCEIPAERMQQAREAAAILGDEVWKRYPWACGEGCGSGGTPVLPMLGDPVEALLNRTWRPTLSVTGVDGIPAMGNAGNVLRPYTAFKLSLRLPPTVDAHRAAQELKVLLEDNAPYQAKVTFAADGRASAMGANGWDAPALAPWLEAAMQRASQHHWRAPLGYIGQGGTIPLMNLLAEGFPKAQMMVCGVLGPKSNAHGPNEFLHIPYGERLTAAVAEVIAAHPC